MPLCLPPCSPPPPPWTEHSSVKVIALKREQMGPGLGKLRFLIFSPPSTFHTHLFEKLNATHRCKELFSPAWLQPRPPVPMAAGTLRRAPFALLLSGSSSGSPNWAVNGSRAGPRSSFPHPGHLAQDLAAVGAQWLVSGQVHVWKGRARAEEWGGRRGGETCRPESDTLGKRFLNTHCIQVAIEALGESLDSKMRLPVYKHLDIRYFGNFSVPRCKSTVQKLS